MYNTTSQTWTIIYAPTALDKCHAVSVGNKVCFAIEHLLYIYDTSKGEWSTATQPTTKLMGGVTAVYNKIYIGGWPNANVYVNTIPCAPTPVAVDPVAPICPGATATLKASGALDYQWTPSQTLSSFTGSTVVASPTATTTYEVRGIGDSGCTTEKTKVTVEVLPKPNVTIAQPAPICFGQVAILQAAGAVDYTWAASNELSSTNGFLVEAMPTTTAVYKVTGTDANKCTNDATVTVVVNPLPLIKVTQSASICLGESITLIAEGATDYRWTPTPSLSKTTGAVVVATPETETTYTVEGVDATGCTNKSSTKISIKPTPPTPKIVGEALVSEVSTLHSSAFSGNQWFKDALALPGATQQTISVMESGVYTVQTTTDGCLSNMSLPFALIVMGLENDSFEYFVYPSPAITEATIQSLSNEKEVVSFQLLDGTRKMLGQKESIELPYAIHLGGYTPGVYFIIITRKNGQRSILRFMRE